MRYFYEIPAKLARAAIIQAGSELEAQHRKGIFDDGDPNHPKYNGGVNYVVPTIFGYDQAAFMTRQYK